jgi:folate-binding protein YgfZ
MAKAFLPDRGIIRVSGADARSFLQGLLTADMDRVAVDRPAFAALLTPQGKVIVDMIVAEADGEWGGDLFLDVPRALAPDLVKRLSLYKLRAQVTLEDLSQTGGVSVYFDGDVPPDEAGVAYVDPRLPALGTRLIAEAEWLRHETFDDEALWQAHRIRLGVPDGGKDFIYGDVFPHEVMMDQLNGIAFNKGCYVGQEVVSRMQHRGTARTRLVPVRYPEGFAAIEGCDIKAGDRLIGKTCTHIAGGIGLALVRLDRVEDAMKAGEPLRAGGIPLTVHKPDWAHFAFPGENGAA